MSGFLASLRHNLANIGRFGGRDARRLFWPYALTVIGVSQLALAAVMVPEIFASMARMQKFAVEHPELATVRSGPGSYSITVEGHHPELMPDIASLIPAMAAVAGLVVLFLAAAVARRLHDVGRSSGWGLLPLPFLATAGLLMPKVFAARQPELGAFFALFVNNLLYLASLGWLIFLLTRPTAEQR